MQVREVSLVGALCDQYRLDAWHTYKDGVLSSYAANGTAAYERQPNGFLVFSKKRGRFEFRDTYFTGVEGTSFGTTLLLYEGMPSWVLQYAGRYDEKAIPCLKAALRAAVSADEFVGGRGPRLYTHPDGYKYVNALSDATFLKSGTGREYVLSPDNTEAGYHIITWGSVN